MVSYIAVITIRISVRFPCKHRQTRPLQRITNFEILTSSLNHYCDTVMLLYFHCISGAPELWMRGAIASSCWLIDWLKVSDKFKVTMSVTEQRERIIKNSSAIIYDSEWLQMRILSDPFITVGTSLSNFSTFFKLCILWRPLLLLYEDFSRV